MTIFAPIEGINPFSMDHEFISFDKGIYEHRYHPFNLSPTTAEARKMFPKIYYNFTLWPHWPKLLTQNCHYDFSFR